MSSEQINRCSTCPFRDAETRECRHDPPWFVLPGTDRGWRATRDEDWCAKHPNLAAIVDGARGQIFSKGYLDQLDRILKGSLDTIDPSIP